MNVVFNVQNATGEAAVQQKQDVKVGFGSKVGSTLD